MKATIKSTKSVAKVKATTHSPESVVAAVYPSAIGVDVHAELLVCAYQCTEGDDQIRTELVEIGTKASDIHAFSQWCLSKDPALIIMESTGVLWRSPYEALEQVGFTADKLALVNARDVKAMIGRKTDKEDAKRLTELARLGHIRKSFIPDKVFRHMRTIARRYQKTTSDIARQTNVYHKLLNSVGCRACSVFSNVRGKAASAILQALIECPEQLKEVVIAESRRLKASPQEILDALDFSMPEFIRAQILDEREQIERLQEFAQSTMQRLRELQEPYEQYIELLQTIPGIKEVAARLIFAELCDNLKDFFCDSEHFCSWLGICPGNKISANKNYSGAAAKGNKWLRRTLTECAQAIGLSQCVFREQFNAFKMRRGTRRAVVAIAHLLSRVIYSVLTRKKDFVFKQATRIQDVLVDRAKQSAKRLLRMTSSGGGTAFSLVDNQTGEIIPTIVTSS